MSTPPDEPRSDDPWSTPPPDRAPSQPPPAGTYPGSGGYPPPGGYAGQPGQGPYGGQPPYGAPPGQAPYGAPGEQPYGSPYGAPTAPARNGMGTAALVLGIVGLALSFVVIGAVPGTLAIIFGAIGRARARRRQATNGGAALAGIITGVLSVVVAVAIVAVGVSLLKTEFRKYQDCLDNAQTFEQQQECRDRFRTSVEDRVNR